jgi:pimeloyl-ACP methyl ester carboxylesterase
MLLLAGLLALLATADGAVAQPVPGCTGDAAHWVKGGRDTCIVLRGYGPARAQVLIVMLHGDVSGGGPARYHFPWAERMAAEVAGAASFALVRPGYEDADRNVSGGSNNNRNDHYTAANMEIMAGAIAALRQRTGARLVLAVGHSGGAATVANILALHPGTIDRAILLSCPCDLVRWRVGRRPWTLSVSPIDGADRVPAGTRLVALTGADDDNTRPELAERYVARLFARGVQARAVTVPGAGHNSLDALWAGGWRAAVIELARP